MARIGLLSDTHGWLDPAVFTYLDSCDEIWHAGDIGTAEVTDALGAFRPLRAVYGNIDDHLLRRQFPQDQVFTMQDVKVCMTHIGGRPGRYSRQARALILSEQPRLFVCGHSHILRVIPDNKYDLLYLNPGACGRHGFHTVRTLLRFTLLAGEIGDMEVVELGPRGR